MRVASDPTHLPPRLAPLVSLLLAAGLVAGCSSGSSVPPPKPPPDGASQHAALAGRTLRALGHAVRSGHESAADRLAAHASPGLPRELVANANALGVRGLRLRYVDDSVTTLSAAQQRRYGAHAWIGAVQVDYRLPMDTGPTSMEVAFTFVPRGGRALVAAIGGHGDRSPLWMRGAVSIVRHGRFTVIDADGRTRHYVALARRAVVDVGRVLRDWHGDLVIEIPRSKAELDSVLHADPRTYADIAAVTTTVDSSLVRGTPIHVFVNPAVMDTLRRKGAQVVISHESTHVATRAPLADMPTWLLEGFADYVALDHAGVPVTKAASQILARVRKRGAPEHLPTVRDLSPTAPGLGATYEEAWLACRYLARKYGERSLVRFYRTAEHSSTLAPAFHRLGTTKAAFVAAWSAAVARLAARAG